MAEEGGDKKHEATPYRRQKAREEGQFAKSQDLASALVLVGAVSTLMWFGPGLTRTLGRIMAADFTQVRYWSSTSQSATSFLVGNITECALAMLPILAAVTAVALAISWMQVGFNFLPEKINFDWQRINPIEGAKRLISVANAVRLGFGLLKIGLVGFVVGLGFWGKWETIIGSSTYAVGDVGLMVWDTTVDLCLRAAAVLFVLAIMDYGYQYWKFEQDLRMSDEELREELKMMQGDPQMVARRRQVQREMLKNRIQSTVPKADVVVTNPTELAIALQFDPKTMPAPIVLAKGAGTVAARIRRVALENDVPVVERKPLAQALFKMVEIGQPIPVEQYAAVAEVLRYVYQLKGRKLPDIAA